MPNPDVFLFQQSRTVQPYHCCKASLRHDWTRPPCSHLLPVSWSQWSRTHGPSGAEFLVPVERNSWSQWSGTPGSSGPKLLVPVDQNSRFQWRGTPGSRGAELRVPGEQNSWSQWSGTPGSSGEELLVPVERNSWFWWSCTHCVLLVETRTVNWSPAHRIQRLCTGLQLIGVREWEWVLVYSS